MQQNHVMAETKSSLSRKNPPPASNSKKASAPLRRSRSVSAVSRSSSDFVVTMDNPLFWDAQSNSPVDLLKETAATDLDVSRSKLGANSGTLNDSGGNARGRSVSRSLDGGRKTTASQRSLSRTPSEAPRVALRDRSVSRGPVSSGTRPTPHSEDDSRKNALLARRNSTESKILTKNKAGSDASSSNLKSSSSKVDSNKTLKNQPMREGLSADPSEQIYETVRAEVRRALADIQDDLQNAVRRSNPSAVELVLDIRREYSTKLEQSHERARKLRADLEEEEHRAQELTRILDDLLAEQKSANLHKPRLGRKSSVERRRMSKQLTEDAMAYFDECVSLSTFDSSDFSSTEDLPFNSNGFGIKPEMGAFNEGSPLSAESVNKGNAASFSGLNKQHDLYKLREEISSYVKSSDKMVKRREFFGEQFDLEENCMRESQQNLLFDRLRMKNRVESGGLLVCGVHSPVTFSAFPFII